MSGVVDQGGVDFSFPQLLFVVLLVGFVLAMVIRKWLGPRSSLSAPGAVLAGIVGAALGTIPANALSLNGLPELAVFLLSGITGTFLMMLLAERFVPRPSASALELIRRGEGAQLEFKSTARYNLRTKARDERMELVIAKTIAAFLNGDAGTLLIGVDDDGQVLGLGNDLSLMKQPDIDRYELWLRDYLVQVIGATATAGVKVEFEQVGDEQVCVVRVPRAQAPVFVRPAKSQSVHFFARIGNSTRELPVDEAIVYAAQHWSGRRSRSRELG